MTFWQTLSPLNKIIKTYQLDSGLTYVSAGNFVAAVSAALFWLSLASILGTESYGRLNYYIALASLLSSVSLFGLNTTVMTYLAKGSERIRYQANQVVLVSNAAIFLLLLIFIGYTPLVFLLIGLSFFMMSVAQLLGKKLYKKYFLIQIGERVTQIALSTTLYFVIGIDGVIIGYAIATLIFSYKFFQSFRNYSLSLSELKPRFKFISHSYSLSLSQSIAFYADKIIIVPLFGLGVLGLYQLGFQFLMFLSLIPASLFQYLLPQESSGVERKKVRFAGFALSLFFAAIFFVTSPLIIEHIFPSYTKSIQATQIMILGVIPMTLNSIINSRLLGRERSKPVFVGATVYLGSLILSFYTLGGMFGLVGLAISVVMSLSLQSLSLWVIDRMLNKPVSK